MKALSLFSLFTVIAEFIMEATDNPQEEYNQLKAELKDLKDQLGSVAGTISNAGMNKARGAIECTNDMIKNRPIPSALTALGAGFVLGMIMAK